MDNFGNAVVAWQQHGTTGSDIKARRVSSGDTVGPVINIAVTSADEANPTVALRRGGGGFVVSYDSAGLLTTDVKVAEVSAFDQVRTLDAGVRFDPYVSINAFDQYILTYTAETFGSIDIRGRLGHL
jgi:hypothetical protein